MLLATSVLLFTAAASNVLTVAPKGSAQSSPAVATNLTSGDGLIRPTPSVCQVPASPATKAEGSKGACRHRLVQVQHSERLAGVPAILKRVIAAGKEHGFLVAPPRLSGGGLALDIRRYSVPFSTYFEPSKTVLPFADADQGCGDDARQHHTSVQLVLKRVKYDTSQTLPTPWWCTEKEQTKLCVLDWTPCDARQRKKFGDLCPKYSTVPRGLMGRIVSGAFDFVEHECSNHVELRMPRGGTWYKDQGPDGPRTPFGNFSAGVMEVASRISNMIMNCSGSDDTRDHPIQSVGAMLRIAQEPYFHKPPSAIEGNCLKAISVLNKWSDYFVPRKQQTCGHFLATDWFVQADVGATKAHKKVMNACLARLGYGIGINTSRWVSIPLQNERRYRMIATAARGLPEIQRAARIDKAGFHSILELAMLAKADACIEATHMVTTITNTIRTSMGKKPCVNLMDKGPWPEEPRSPLRAPSTSSLTSAPDSPKLARIILNTPLSDVNRIHGAKVLAGLCVSVVVLILIIGILRSLCSC